MDNFILDTRKLVNSLVIKDELVAKMLYIELFNNGTIRDENEFREQVDCINGEISSTDPRLKDILYNNKYYLNLYGLRYRTDRKVFIKMMETNEELELTKELLEEYKDTKKELLKCSAYYDNIIANNLDMVDYIHGCMYPVEPYVAFRAKNGSILNYNKSFLESQEDYLIEELNNYTLSYLGDKLPNLYLMNNQFFVPSYLYILRNQLLGIALGKRLSKINTMYAHSFFLTCKFRSTLDIWDEVKTLNKETIWWLYTYIDRYVSNIGTNLTFDMLLNDILAKNNIGIGTYRIVRRDPMLSRDQYNYEEPAFTKQPIVANVRKLNSAFTANDDQDSDMSILNRELIDIVNTKDEDAKEYENTFSVKEIEDNYTSKFDTKVIEISALESYNSYNIDIFKMLLDYWAYFLNNGLYGHFTLNKPTTKVDYVDPNTLETYSIDSRLGFLMVIKLLLHAAGKDSVNMAVFTYTNVINPDAKLVDVMKNVYQDGYTDKLTNVINSILPEKMKETSSISDVSNYLTNVLSFFKKYWYLTSNVENPVVSSNLSKIMKLLSLKETCYFHRNNGEMFGVLLDDPTIKQTYIDDVLKENGINFKVYGNYNYVEGINELMKTCLGVIANNDIKLKDLLNGYKSLIRKMKSYTIEVTGSVKSEDKSDVCYQHVGVLLSHKGLLTLDPEAVDVVGLEEEYYKTSFEVYEANEDPQGVHYLEKATIKPVSPEVVDYTYHHGEICVLPNSITIELL